MYVTTEKYFWLLWDFSRHIFVTILSHTKLCTEKCMHLMLSILITKCLLLGNVTKAAHYTQGSAEHCNWGNPSTTLPNSSTCPQDPSAHERLISMATKEHEDVVAWETPVLQSETGAPVPAPWLSQGSPCPMCQGTTSTRSQQGGAQGVF